MPTIIVDLGDVRQARLEAAALASAQNREAWRLLHAYRRIDQHLERLARVNSMSLLDPRLIDRLEELAETICAIPIKTE